MNMRLFAFLAATLAMGSLCLADETNTLDKHLEPLRPLLGKTFRSEFKGPDTGNPVSDVLKWERALNGRAIRTLHSLNDGMYGGETLYVWDNQEQAVKYFYFTTAGFRTTGTFEFKDGKIHTHETVVGSAGDIKEVKAVSEVKPDGTFVVKVEHLTTKGQWVSAPPRTYKPDPGAEVRFK